MSEVAIKIDGLAQFSRNLKKLDAELPKMLRLALNEVADVVIQAAKPKIPKRSGRAANSLRVASTRTSVRVRAGGPKAPHYAWLDFGGRVGRKKSVRRPYLKEGRYLYRVYFDKRDSGELHRVLEKALLDVARQAGVEVT